ncbi:MAG: hypothetical protein ACE5DM_05770 [Candidatus Nanoarchaeia archaeon]
MSDRADCRDKADAPEIEVDARPEDYTGLEALTYDYSALMNEADAILFLFREDGEERRTDTEQTLYKLYSSRDYLVEQVEAVGEKVRTVDHLLGLPMKLEQNSEAIRRKNEFLKKHRGKLTQTRFKELSKMFLDTAAEFDDKRRYLETKLREVKCAQLARMHELENIDAKIFDFESELGYDADTIPPESTPSKTEKVKLPSVEEEVERSAGHSFCRTHFTVPKPTISDAIGDVSDDEFDAFFASVNSKLSPRTQVHDPITSIQKRDDSENPSQPYRKVNLSLARIKPNSARMLRAGVSDTEYDTCEFIYSSGGNVGTILFAEGPQVYEALLKQTRLLKEVLEDRELSIESVDLEALRGMNDEDGGRDDEVHRAVDYFSFAFNRIVTTYNRSFEDMVAACSRGDDVTLKQYLAEQKTDRNLVFGKQVAQSLVDRGFVLILDDDQLMRVFDTLPARRDLVTEFRRSINLRELYAALDNALENFYFVHEAYWENTERDLASLEKLTE